MDKNKMSLEKYYKLTKKQRHEMRFNGRLDKIKRLMNGLLKEVESKYHKLQNKSKNVIHIKRKDFDNLLKYRKIVKIYVNPPICGVNPLIEMFNVPVYQGFKMIFGDDNENESIE